MAFGISVSRSGSFADALKAEISRIVDRIYADHCEYLPPERIERHQIEDLVHQILVFNQQKKQEQLQDWNEVKNPSRRASLNQKNSSTSQD